MMFTLRGMPTGTDLLCYLQRLLDDYPTYDVTGDDDSVDAVLAFSDLSDPGRFSGDSSVVLTFSDGTTEREWPWPQARMVRAEPDTVPTVTTPGPAGLVRR